MPPAARTLGHAQTSISSASPWPPPEQIAASPSPPPLAAQLVHERREDPAARGADRVAERDRAAVDVDALLVGAEQRASSAAATEANASLISTRATSSIVLPGARRARPRPPSPACGRGRRTRRRRSPGRGSSRAARSRAARAHSSLATSTQEAPSLTPGALPAVVVPSRVEDRLQRGELLERGVAARRLVERRARRPATISSAKRPASIAATARAVRAVGPGVLLLARDAELARDERGLLDHVPAVEARDEPVVDHQVDQRRRRRAGSRSGPGRARRGRSTSTPSRR